METVEFMKEFSTDIFLMCLDALMAAGTVWTIKKMFFSK